VEMCTADAAAIRHEAEIPQQQEVWRRAVFWVTGDFSKLKLCI
jgi:hypothetical protein